MVVLMMKMRKNKQNRIQQVQVLLLAENVQFIMERVLADNQACIQDKLKITMLVVKVIDMIERTDTIKLNYYYNSNYIRNIT